MKKPTAFTLIELLVVIGIISILASIALVNMQEAQTRAKVARAQSDLRSLATAIEAYSVDHSRYPQMVPLGPIELFLSRDERILTETHITRSPSIVPSSITTPIAYITGRPLQPFQLKIYDEPFDPLMTYIYYRPYYYNEWEDAAANGILLPLVPKYDFFLECQFGAWVMWSAGPDTIDWYANWADFLDPVNPGSLLECPVHPTWSWSYHVPYDPTNGTTSFGNIHRSQKLELKACCCPGETGKCCGSCTPTPTPVNNSSLLTSSVEERVEDHIVPVPEPLRVAVWN